MDDQEFRVPPFPSPTVPRLLVLAAMAAAVYRVRYANIHGDHREACNDIARPLCLGLALGVCWLLAWFLGWFPERLWRRREPRAALSWEPTEQPGTHKDGRFVELCCGGIQGRAHTIVGRWNIDAQDRAGWYGTDGNAIGGATHWRELSPLPGRE